MQVSHGPRPWTMGLRGGGDGSGSAFLLRSRCSPGPGHEFVDAIIRPAVYELGEDVCEISLRIDAVQFCRLDQRCETCPVDRALVVAGKKCVLSIMHIFP